MAGLLLLSLEIQSKGLPPLQKKKVLVKHLETSSDLQGA